jgi:anthranilate synthase component II
LIVIIDNYDSFTYNLFQYVAHYCDDILVLKNDEPKIDSLDINTIKAFIFSPGPGRPSDAGKMPKLINLYATTIPMLGICLGHQAIVENFGGNIINANKVCHGKVHYIDHYSNSKIFKGIKVSFRATRYHSLVVSQKYFPDSLKITAKTKIDNEIMAIEHKEKLIFGLQFHPESIETEYGLKMVKNFIDEIR